MSSSLPQSESTIQLGGYTFDPLVEPLAVPDELRARSAFPESTYYIVQFTQPLTREERVRIQSEYGLHLTQYAPQFAFLEKVNSQILVDLSRDPLFRSITVYQPAFKISPYIG